LSDREALLLGILSLWRARVPFFLHALKEGEIEEWINSVVKLWELHVDISIKIATANSFQQMAELSFRMRPMDPWFDVILAWMKWAL
jgi:neurofibromin 1